ncbi:hypothetical protein [Rhodococcus qingshengii]|uniref:hypothetical protein n=1 Tax=Rhodococcus qingshengii TaxID=334542 RepID=UPI0035D6B3BB
MTPYFFGSGINVTDTVSRDRDYAAGLIGHRPRGRLTRPHRNERAKKSPSDEGDTPTNSAIDEFDSP